LICDNKQASASLRDPEGTVGSHDASDDGELALHGRHGDRRKYGVLLSGNEQDTVQTDEQPEQSPEGDVVTGWEDERAKFQMGQGFGSLDEETDGAASEEFMEAPEHSAWGANDFSELVDVPADMDSEVTQWQMRF